MSFSKTPFAVFFLGDNARYCVADPPLDGPRLFRVAYHTNQEGTARNGFQVNAVREGSRWPTAEPQVSKTTPETASRVNDLLGMFSAISEDNHPPPKPAEAGSQKQQAEQSGPQDQTNPDGGHSWDASTAFILHTARENIRLLRDEINKETARHDSLYGSGAWFRATDTASISEVSDVSERLAALHKKLSYFTKIVVALEPHP